MAADLFALVQSSLLWTSIPIVLILSYLIVALSFMLSQIFSNRDLEVWSKAELNEAFISTLYVASILAVIPLFNLFICSFYSSFSGASGACDVYALDSSSNFILSTYNEIMGGLLNGIFKISYAMAGLGMAGAFSVYPSLDLLNIHPLFALTVSPQFNPLAPLSVVPLGVYQMTFTGFLALLSLISNYVIYDYFIGEFFALFFPLALFFRAFTFTRKLGSTLLAIVVGAYFFLPLAMVLDVLAYDSIKDSLPLEPEQPALVSVAGGSAQLFTGSLSQLGMDINPFTFIPRFCSELFSGASWLCWPFAFLAWPFVIISDIILMIGSFASSIISSTSLMWWAALTPSGFISSLNSYIIAFFLYMVPYGVLAILFPIINFLVVIAGMRSFLVLFGGDEQILNMLSFI